MVQYGPFIPDLVPVEQLGQFLVGQIGKGQQEFFIAVFAYDFHKIIDGAGSEEYFPFTVNNVFLQIKGNRFGYAEVLHEIRYDDPQLTTHAEKMVNGSFAVKDHPGMVENIDSLLSEIFTCYTFNMTERTEIDFNIVFFS
jgi:hypothetical protein